MLVEGDEWAHVEALDPDAGYWARRFTQLVSWRARGRESRDRAVVPSAAELVKQLKEIARLRAEGALTKSEFEAVKARLPSTKPRLKKLVRRPQWTKRDSAGQHCCSWTETRSPPVLVRWLERRRLVRRVSLRALPRPSLGLDRGQRSRGGSAVIRASEPVLPDHLIYLLSAISARVSNPSGARIMQEYRLAA